MQHIGVDHGIGESRTVATATPAETFTTLGMETLEQVWDDALPLLAAQADELAPYADIRFNPDRKAYQAADAAGALRIFTVRGKPSQSAPHGVLVGYAVFFVRANPHYRLSLQAVQDVLWLEPEYRRGGLGVELIHFCERYLGLEGVQVVLHHAKVKAPQLSRVLFQLGYEAIDTIWAKRLDK